MSKNIKIVLLIISVVTLTLFSLSKSSSAEASSGVKSFFKKNGTFVQPHFRSSPNKSKLDNFSSKGNINPFNGKKGYKKGF